MLEATERRIALGRVTVSAGFVPDGMARRQRLLHRPDPERAPDEDQLTHVIGAVVGDEQELPEVGLAGTVRDSGEEIDRGIARELLQRIAVAPECGHAFLPGRARRRRRPGGPIIPGPRALLVCGVPTKIEYVLLGDPQVLEELPGRERDACRSGATVLGCDPFDRRVESHVGILPVEQLQHLLAERSVWIHTLCLARSKSPIRPAARKNAPTPADAA